MIPIFRQFSIRYIKERKGRTITTIFGITLGIVLIIATAIVNRTTVASFEELVSTAAGKAQLQVLSSTNGGFPEDYLKDIKKINGVSGAYPIVTGNSKVIRSNEQIDLIMIYGVEINIDKEVRDYDLTKGRLVKEEDREIVLTEQWARINQYKTGDKISLLTKNGLKFFKVVGLISDKGVGFTNGGKFAITNLRSGREMFAREERLDQVDITIKDGFTIEEVKADLENRLTNDLIIERPSGRGKDIEDTMASYNFFLSLTGAISLLVGIFIIYNNMEISVEERRFHIAMLRALGLKRKKIIALVLTEAGLLGLVGGIIGIILGFGLARGMASVVSDLTSALIRVNITRLELTPEIIITGLIAGPIIAIISSLGPAYGMLKINPLEALNPIETSWGNRNKNVIVTGIISLILGLIILFSFVFIEDKYFENLTAGQAEGFGVVGIGLLLFGLIVLMPIIFKIVLKRIGSRSVTFSLALDNLARTPGRTSATVAGVMIALIMMILVATISSSSERFTRDWIERAIGWDMLVSSGFEGTVIDVPVDEVLGQKLRKMKEIKIANTLRFTRTQYKGKHLMLNTFDMETLFDFADFNIVDGSKNLFEKRMKTGRYIALNTVAGKKLRLKAGEEIKFNTPKGPKYFNIAGIVNETGGDIGVIYMDRLVYKKLWNDSRVDGYDVVLNEGYSVDKVKKKIENKFGKDYYLDILTHENFEKNILALIKQSFTLSNLIVYIALIVAAVGIMNTALISVWQRTREISILRAVGARKNQARLILLNEALVIGLIGTLVGILIGSFLGKIMVDANAKVTGVFLQYYVPWVATVIAFVLAMILSVLSSIIPGRVAARLNIVEGLRYE